MSAGTLRTPRVACPLAALALTTLVACRQRAEAPLVPAAGLQPPAYQYGAARAKAELGRAEVELVNDEPRTCTAIRSDELVRFGLSVGPDRIGTSRAEDRVRLTTGAIGRREGQEGYEAPVESEEIHVSGGIVQEGLGGKVRFAPDLQSGVAFVGSGDDRAKITFRC